MYRVVVLALLGAALSGCMSAEEKQRVISQKADTACYAMGHNKGTDSYNRCVAGAGLIFGDQLEREQQAKREAIASSLESASVALQAAGQAGRVNTLHCTSTRGFMGTVETTCQ